MGSRDQVRGQYQLDAYDTRILTLLEEDARRTNSDIARVVGLSPATIGERIARLRDVGVITGFAVKLDPARLGYPLAAIVEFEPSSRYDDDGVRAVANHPAVRSCYKVTGRSLLMLLVRVRDHAELNDALVEFNRFGQTHTSVILTSELDERPWFFDGWGDPMEALLRRTQHG
jgi:Lrp/AsnC family transcriptional regulator, leucine-responsive regulatory protein